MPYHIDSIELFVRETPPGRAVFALGKDGRPGGSVERLTNPLVHVRLRIHHDDGRETFGCAADRMSVRWLDKRPMRSRGAKLRELVDLIETAQSIYLDEPTFSTPFGKWLAAHERITEAGRASHQEDLTTSFASALFERAVLDGVARLHQQSLFEMVKSNRLGIEPGMVHREIRGFDIRHVVPSRPVTRFRIRHTVGLADPLTDAEIPADQRINDGLPESLEGHIRDDGVTYFKVKVSGDVEHDLNRLEQIWGVVPKDPETAITLDANESYDELEQFVEFTDQLRVRQPGLFDHILYIEQPLPRRLTFDENAAKAIRKVGEIKPVIIDEADGTLDAFRRAAEVGYTGTSHKNCKGFFKSLLNLALMAKWADRGRSWILSGEDLQNLPVVPLHQDFAALSILGLEHCERNGHHYNYGLSFLSADDQRNVTRRHRDLYVRRRDEWFLRIEEGVVLTASLQCPGFGVGDEPDWESMEPLRTWVDRRFPPE